MLHRCSSKHAPVHLPPAQRRVRLSPRRELVAPISGAAIAPRGRRDTRVDQEEVVTRDSMEVEVYGGRGLGQGFVLRALTVSSVRRPQSVMKTGRALRPARVLIEAAGLGSPESVLRPLSATNFAHTGQQVLRSMLAWC